MPNRGRPIPRCRDGRLYREGCRCSFCKQQIATANALYLHRRTLRERGVISDQDLIDATETRKLLLRAQECKITDRDLEMLTGLTRESFTRIRSGKSSRVRRETATLISRALADMEVVKRHDMTLVDGRWSRQMQLSLCAQGWTRQHQRDILKNNLQSSGGFITSRRIDGSKVYYKNVKQMKWLVRAIGERRGPATALAARMQTRGVFPAKHYNVYGELIVSSLTEEQRSYIAGV